VERERHAALVLDRPRPGDSFGEGFELRSKAPGIGIRFEPVDAYVFDPLDADEPAHIGGGSAADAGDEPVAPGQPLDLPSSLVGDGRVFRPLDDRRERPVDVEENGGVLGLAAEASQQGGSAHE
jgi:hypothetical protein